MNIANTCASSAGAVVCLPFLSVSFWSVLPVFVCFSVSASVLLGFSGVSGMLLLFLYCSFSWLEQAFFFFFVCLCFLFCLQYTQS